MKKARIQITISRAQDHLPMAMHPLNKLIAPSRERTVRAAIYRRHQSRAGLNREYLSRLMNIESRHTAGFSGVVFPLRVPYILPEPEIIDA